MAHRHGAKVVLDAAQSVAHLGADVQALTVTSWSFPGTKFSHLPGIGVVFGKADILDNTPPWQGGGKHDCRCHFRKDNVSGSASKNLKLARATLLMQWAWAALDYLEEIGMENIARYEHELLEYGPRSAHCARPEVDWNS